MNTLVATQAKAIPATPLDATMRAGVLCDVRRFEVRDVPRPRASLHDVLVRVTAVGLCGTDSHIFEGHANYNLDTHGKPIPLRVQPQILGHEIAGYVEEADSEVLDLAIGDRVVLDQGLNCVSVRRSPLCEYCQTGDSHQCEYYNELGLTGLPGGLAEFIAVPAVNVVRINSRLEFEEAALAEPLGCIIHSSDVVTRARTRYAISAGSAARVRSVLICGAGPAGLLFTQYLRNVLSYDALLLVSEPNANKRELAKSLGADKTIDPLSSDLTAEVKKQTLGRGVEYLIEASGAGPVLAAIPGLIRKQATVVLYGHGHPRVNLSVLNNLMFKEPVLVTPVGASGGFERDGRPSVYTRALRMIEQKLVDVASLITHRYTELEAVSQALRNDFHTPDYVKGIVLTS